MIYCFLQNKHPLCLLNAPSTFFSPQKALFFTEYVVFSYLQTLIIFLTNIHMKCQIEAIFIEKVLVSTQNVYFQEIH